MLVPEHFASYALSTSHLVLYRMGSQFVHPRTCFPHVTTLSLVHCTRVGVSKMLQPAYFPHLKTIHYLSAHPGEYDIYRRFHPPSDGYFPRILMDFMMRW